MDDFDGHVQRLIDWLNPAPRVPLVFAEPGFRQDLLTVPQPFVELYVVTEGQLRFSVGPHSAVIGVGDMALANAHFGNAGHNVSGPFRYGCLSLEIPDERSFAAWTNRPWVVVRAAQNPARVEELFREVAHVYHGPNFPLREISLKALVLQLLVAVAEAGVHEGGSTQNPHVRKAVEVMAEQRADPGLTLAQLARRVGVSPSHLVRLFQDSQGKSPMRHLLEQRLRHAGALLLRSNLSVKEIAFMVGFRDPLYFSRAFRQQTGKSPRAFREAGGRDDPAK